MSPSSSSCRAAILRKILRMILPLRVLGSPGAQWILSGAANAPICKKKRHYKSCEDEVYCILCLNHAHLLSTTGKNTGLFLFINQPETHSIRLNSISPHC